MVKIYTHDLQEHGEAQDQTAIQEKHHEAPQGE